MLSACNMDQLLHKQDLRRKPTNHMKKQNQKPATNRVNFTSDDR
jgi:hypothetical protein